MHITLKTDVAVLTDRRKPTFKAGAIVNYSCKKTPEGWSHKFVGWLRNDPKAVEHCEVSQGNPTWI